MARRKASAKAETTIRMKEPLRAEIERVAKRRGISMNAETVDRLTRSFRDDELAATFHQNIHGSQLGALLLAIGKAVKDTGMAADVFCGRLSGDWTADAYVFDQVARAIHTIVEAFRPPGDATPPAEQQPLQTITLGEPPPQPPLAPIIGESIAAGILEALANPERGGGIGEWAKPVRANLGQLAERLAPLAVTPKSRRPK